MPEESKKAKGRGGRSFMPLYERRRQAKKKTIEEITDPAGGRRLAQLVGRSGHSQAPSQEATAASHARSAGGRLFSRKGVAVAGAAAAGVGGAAYLAGRAQRRKSNTVAKLYDPFTGEYVEVEKGLRSNFRAVREGSKYSRALSKPERKIYRRAGYRAQLGDTKGIAMHLANTAAGSHIGGRVARAAAQRHGVPAHQVARWESRGRSLGYTAASVPGSFRAGATGSRAGREAVERSRVGKAAYPVAWPPPRSTGLQARTPQGKFVSHANDLKVVHYHPKRNPTSKLVQIKHGPRSVSGSSVGKSLGSGAVKIGSRITGA